jgi:hypothetical protein
MSNAEGYKRLLIMSLASYEKFWYNGLKLIPSFILIVVCIFDHDTISTLDCSWAEWDWLIGLSPE